MLSKRFVLVAFAALAIAALAGCGSSSKSSKGDTTTTIKASGDKAAFCADNAEMSAALKGVTDPAEGLKIFKEHEATLNKYASDAPVEIRDAATEQAQAALDAIKANDSSKLENPPPPLSEASNKVTAFCGQTGNSPTATVPATAG